MDKQDFESFLDDYVTFKTQLAVAQAIYEYKANELKSIKTELDKFRDKPEYIEMMRLLHQKHQKVYEELEEAEAILTELNARKQGYEERKQEVSQDLTSEQMGK